ncbi:hypothetical protein [Streptomyces sp. NPDC016845]|uniref:hypothetical protein n=1 Tax=Streptomyces sp. NPDC016845 TaxID=3364972 RepID=UPI0037B8670A
MSAAAGPVRAARYYTSARRLPWVIGKFADWKIPFGPFNAVQIALLSLGGLLLVRTAPLWWAYLGPVPVVAWATALFVCRRHKVAGRTPAGCALGVLARIVQPVGGRIGGRAARDRRPQPLTGSFTLQPLACPEVSATTVWPHILPRQASRRAALAPRSWLAPKPPATALATAPAVARRSLSPIQVALLAAQEQN